MTDIHLHLRSHEATCLFAYPWTKIRNKRIWQCARFIFWRKIYGSTYEKKQHAPRGTKSLGVFAYVLSFESADRLTQLSFYIILISEHLGSSKTWLCFYMFLYKLEPQHSQPVFCFTDMIPWGRGYIHHFCIPDVLSNNMISIWYCGMLLPKN